MYNICSRQAWNDSKSLPRNKNNLRYLRASYGYTGWLLGVSHNSGHCRCWRDYSWFQLHPRLRGQHDTVFLDGRHWRICSPRPDLIQGVQGALAVWWWCSICSTSYLAFVMLTGTIIVIISCQQFQRLDAERASDSSSRFHPPNAHQPIRQSCDRGGATSQFFPSVHVRRWNAYYV